MAAHESIVSKRGAEDGDTVAPSPHSFLHLEDTISDAELVEMTMRKKGLAFTITRVETGEAYASELEHRTFDLIFSDYRLPMYDGFSALKLAREKTPTTPFILITGQLDEETAMEFVKAGATDYVLKDGLYRLVPAVTRALQEAKNDARRGEVERQLRESEATLRALFAAITDVALIMDRDGRYLKIAPSAPALGFPPAEKLLGKTLHEVFPKEKADFILKQIRLALSTHSTIRFEHQLSIQGREIWVLATVSPISEDRVVVVARDISDQKTGIASEPDAVLTI